MANVQQKIEALEAAAAECDLISELAIDKLDQSRNKRLAAEYLNVANDLKHPELIASEQRVAVGQKLVARQRGIVARLESQGHSTERARQFLAALEDTLSLFEQSREDHWRHKP